MSSDDRRGAELFAVELAERLDGEGQSHVVVALAPGVAGGLGVPVLGPARFRPATLLALRRRVAGARVVVAHGSSTLPAVAAATRGRVCPSSIAASGTRRPGSRRRPAGPGCDWPPAGRRPSWLCGRAPP